MNKLYKSSTICLLLLILYAEGFSHEQQAKWYDEYPDCNLDRQSPIELNSNEATTSYSIPALNFVNYDVTYTEPVVTQNTGHTVDSQLPAYLNSEWLPHDSQFPYIYDGPLPNGYYIPQSFHFHWGSKDAHGSEHVIDGRRYSLEMHIVHKNSKYATVAEASNYIDGLTVLAVLFQTQESAPYLEDFDVVLKAISLTTAYEDTTHIYNFTLSSLLGNLKTTEFFTYEGSLTTPPCSQAVTWIVFTDIKTISPSQMHVFHSLSDSHGVILENNYRSLQAKANRKIYLRKSRQVIDTTVESNLYKILRDKLIPQ
ncbi:carbonic anhydrase 2-like [Teleopsis dalmanni]|uniref:carbonic anhydrase 2-like n=1 Tax=Teleopsis dalmanni TaxID=139649 RepID=UPI0018CE67A9|nr:carbonic anhydrase 2-like [Teleopsis dalmanni]